MIALGALEYWRYDATGGEFYGEPLVGEYLEDGEYRRLELRQESDRRLWSHSEVLDLDIWWTDGDLRLWDPIAGVWLLRRDEERASRLQERRRAEAAESRVQELEVELRDCARSSGLWPTQLECNIRPSRPAACSALPLIYSIRRHRRSDFWEHSA